MHTLIEFFSDSLGRHRLAWGLVLVAINVALLMFVGLIWFWLWAIAIVLTLSSLFGEF